MIKKIILKKNSNLTGQINRCTFLLSIVICFKLLIISGIFPLYAQSNNALYFDGIDDNVIIQDSNSLDVSANFTIEAWVNPTSFSGQNYFISKYDTDGFNRGYIVGFGHVGNPDELVVVLDETGDLSNNLTWGTGIAFDTNTWYHIAVTYDNLLVVPDGISLSVVFQLIFVYFGSYGV